MRVSRLWAAVAAVVLIGMALTTAFASLGQSGGQPAVVSAAAPAYPPSAAAASASGEVAVEVGINAKGEVVSARSLEGHALLRGAAEAAARKWKFAPAADGASTGTARLTFVFRLREKGDDRPGLSAVFRPPYEVEVSPPAVIEKSNN